MLNTLLLVMQLIPEFLILSAIVVMGHWIWLFGIKKGGSANLSPSKMGNNRVSNPIDATQAAQFIPKSSHSSSLTKTGEKPAEGENKGEPAGVRFQPQATDATEFHAAVAVQSSTTAFQKQLTLKYAGSPVTELVCALQNGKLTPEEIRELNELAALTIANQQQHAQAIDLLKGLFDPHQGNHPLIPFIS